MSGRLTSRIGVATLNSSFQYTLHGYYDPSIDSSENGLNYHNNPFSHCSVQLIEVAQYLWNPVTDQVSDLVLRLST